MSGRITIGKLLESIRGDGVGATVARGATGSLVVSLFGVVLALISQVLLTRLMGVEHYGDYIYVFTWMVILAHLAKFGLDTTLLKYAAVYRSGEEWGLLRGVLRKSHLLVAMGATAAAAITALVVSVAIPESEASLRATFLLGCVLLPVLAMSGLGQMGLRALKRVVLAQIPDSIVMPAALMAITAAAFVVLPENGLTGPVGMGLQIAATSIAFMFVYAWLKRSMPAEAKSGDAAYRTNEWLQTALPLMLITGSAILLQRTSVVMTGMIMGTADAGNLAAAARISTLIVFGLNAVNAIAAPMIAELHHQNKKDELQRMVSYAALGLLLFSIPASIGLIVIGRWLLALFDPSFVAAYGALVFLIIGQLVNALSGSVGFLLTMTGRQTIAATTVGVVALLNLPLNWILISRYGMAGAGAATGISIALLNVVNWVIVVKQLGIDPTFVYLLRRRG